jgi:hypothetical protein
MTLKHKIIQVNSSTSTLLTDLASNNDFYMRKLNISIQNLDTEQYLFIGDNTVSNSSYGLRLDPAEIVSIDLSPNDDLYAISDSGTFNVAVLKVYEA